MALATIGEASFTNLYAVREPLSLTANQVTSILGTPTAGYVGISISFYYNSQIDIYFLEGSANCASTSVTTWKSNALASKVGTTLNNAYPPTITGNQQNSFGAHVSGDIFILQFGGISSASSGSVQAPWSSVEVCVGINNNAATPIISPSLNITIDNGLACEGSNLCSLGGTTAKSSNGDYCCHGDNAVLKVNANGQTTCGGAMGICPFTTYSWSAIGWNACNQPCKAATSSNNPTKTTAFGCLSSFGDYVNATNCAGIQLPASQPATCNTQLCQYSRTAPYGNCSVTCGTGYQYQDFVCQDGLDNTIALSYCAQATCCGGGAIQCVQPSCAPQVYNWTTGPWGACSTTCGQGIQSRTVWCQAPNLACTPINPPIQTTSCILQACAGETGISSSSSSTGKSDLSDADSFATPTQWVMLLIAFCTFLGAL